MPIHDLSNDCLKGAAGKARLPNLECPNCTAARATDVATAKEPKWYIHERYQWCLCLTCQECKHNWFVCTVCTNLRSVYKDQRSLTVHNSKFHVSEKRESSNSKKRKIDDDTPPPPEDAEYNEKEPNHPQSDTEDGLQGNHEKEDDLPIDTNESTRKARRDAWYEDEMKVWYSNMASFNYFEKKRHGHGERYLVAMATHQNTLHLDRITDEDIQLHLRIGSFCNNISAKQQEQFAAIMRLIDHRIDTTPKQDSIPCRMPNSPNDLRRMYLDGKFSLRSNLPIPTIHRRGEYSYCLPSECIQNLLAHGVKVDNIVNREFTKYDDGGTVTCLSEAKCVCVIAEEYQQYEEYVGSKRDDMVVLWLSWWSDSFEPNTSTKANRQGVWIKTLTISRPSDATGASVVHTFPICIGPKNGDKNVVERQILLDLDKLSITTCGINKLIRMYDERSRSFKSVCAKVCLCLHDQLDRRSTVTLSQGNSTYHRMFGWSHDFLKTYRLIVACPNCVSSMNREHSDAASNLSDVTETSDKPYFWRSGKCEECTAWFMHKQSDLLKYELPHELTRCFPPGTTLGPMELSFELLRRTVSFAHEKVRTGEWTTTVAEEYLKLHCIPSSFIQQFNLHGKHANLLYRYDNDIVDINENFQDNRELLHDEVTLNPYLYEQVRLPALWEENGMPLSFYTEAPMHLLFLGIVETIVKTVHEWCLRRRLGTDFCRYADTALKEIIALQVPWCKQMKYSQTGKFGGWVSENYLGFSRLIPWFYNVVNSMSEAQPYSHPTKSIDQWNKKECLQWLKQKGLKDYNDNNLQQMRSVITRNKHLLDTEMMPRIVGKQLVINVLRCLTRLLRTVMTKTTNKSTKAQVELAVRLFLTSYHRFDLEWNRYPEGHRRYVPSWISKYNFLSLLKLPETIEQNGPLRGFWEGSSIGEGILRHVKPEIQRGLRYQWQDWLLTNLLQRKAYDILNETFDAAAADRDREEIPNYKVYASEAVALRKFHEGLVCSCVVIRNDQLVVHGMVYRSGTSRLVIPITIIPEPVDCLNDLNYFRFEIESGNSSHRDVKAYERDDGMNTSVGSLLLPKTALDGSGSSRAGHPCSTMIFSDWTALTSTSHF